MPIPEEEERAILTEQARQMLSEGTWPKVCAVIEYATPKAPRASEEEFAKLAREFVNTACPNLAAFVRIVEAREQERGISLSFNLSLRPRSGQKDGMPTEKEVAAILFFPDILVGTRGGLDGAAVWFKNFLAAVPLIFPEQMQVMDNIFGEAVECLKGPPQTWDRAWDPQEEAGRERQAVHELFDTSGNPTKH